VESRATDDHEIAFRGGKTMRGGWERLASYEGGTVFALATALTKDGNATALFAATAAGLFHSRNEGREWTPAGEMPLPMLAAVTPSVHFAENSLIYAGTQTGFYRSSDAGRTWRQTLAGGRVFTIASVPTAGQEDRLFVGTEEDGILRSDDGGRTWAGANPGLLDLTVLALAFSPDAARDHVGFAGAASGLYRTGNSGKSWRDVGLPLDDPAVQCLAVSPAFARNQCVFAGTEDDGLWRSDNGGASWNLVPGLPTGGISAITFAPHGENPHLVAAATSDGIALSHDAGVTWRFSGQALPPVLSLAFIANGTRTTLVAGLFRAGIARLTIATTTTTTNGGNDRWSLANDGLGATLLTQLLVSPSFADDRTLFVAGPEAGIRVSRDGGHTWAETGESFADAAVHGLAASPRSRGGHVLFAATSAGVYRSPDNGTHWEAPTSGGQSSARLVAARVTGDDALTPVFAVTQDNRLITSDNGGEEWHPLNTPFTRSGATIIALVCARNRTLYVGASQPAAATGAGAVTLWRSIDGGKSWISWLEERGETALLPLTVAATTGFVPGKSADEALFVGLAGRVLQPRRNVWQTRDNVQYPLWGSSALAMGESERPAVTALAVSPNYHTDGVIFAATSIGIYRSCTRGHEFDYWSKGFIQTPVLALATTASVPVSVFALSIDGTIWEQKGDP